MNPPEDSERGTKRPYSEISDEDIKKEGDGQYHRKNYEKALECYSSAISKNSKIARYLISRALAAYRLRRYVGSVADCKSALELEPEHVDAHYTLGLALCSLKKFDEGLSSMRKAIQFGKIHGTTIADKMEKALIRWTKIRDKVAEQKAKQLQTYLTRLVEEDGERQVEKMKKAAGFHFVSGKNGKTWMVRNQSKLSLLEKRCQSRMTELKALFPKVEKRGVPIVVVDLETTDSESSTEETN